MTVRKLSEVLCAVVCVLALMPNAFAADTPQVPAYPGAEGYGSVARGGRGGKVIAVTNLNASGPGSLQAACGAKGPRIIVFRVAGTIDGNVNIKNDNITIAGQTAPGDGICVKGNVGISASDVIIRYIRVRPNATGDAISGRGIENVILDHVSCSWSNDEVLSIYQAKNLTIQYCLISEACQRQNSHRFGGIWGAENGSYHHNCFAHNDNRTPRWSGKKNETNDFRNNVLYNIGYGGCNGALSGDKINMVANYYKPGPATKSPSRIAASYGGDWYLHGNVVVGSEDVTNDNWKGMGGKYTRKDAPWPAMPIRQESAEEAYKTFLEHGGCSLPNRDALDKRIIEEIRTGTAKYGNKGIIDHPNDVGGWPTLAAGTAPEDSDSDGMPDAWERRYGLDPKDASDNVKDKDKDGYTNVEEYLNRTDPAVFVDYTANETKKPRYRIIVSTDIGGTDPDDFQSMVHLLAYADVLDIEGLISSPFDMGRKEDILQVIDCYEKDYANLKTYSDRYPTPDALRAITKQGEIDRAPYAGVRQSTEGSRWIIECARRDDPRPLHVLVWGLIEDLAQALHDAPDILPKLRVYWIGGPNKKWSPDAYQYIVDNHPELWIIESNSTYRGWFVGGAQKGEWGNRGFVAQHIVGKGALGDFFNSKMSRVKMGDTPSVGWVLNGIPSDPSKPGWGGRFVRAWERPYVRFDRLTTQDDRMEIFGIFELVLPLGDDAPDKPETQIRVGNQKLVGHAPGDGTMRFRFCPKSKGTFSYKISGNVPALEGKAGKILVTLPKAEQADKPASNLPNWWTDDPNPAFAEGDHHGGKTVSRWREDFLADFAQRMLRCQKPASTKTGVAAPPASEPASDRPRVIVTSDGEIDDQCSMIRFLLYTNECDVEAIVLSSSQYHSESHGHWAGNDWVDPDLAAYEQVYPNLIKHDPRYPTPDYLRARTAVGNVKTEGEMATATAGSDLIVKALLDKSDDRPIWMQAWGGMNTISRALKTIEENHPERMAEVAAKCRFFFIWEQDATYQEYIRPHWGKYNIPTIVSDQFEAVAYRWKQIQPKEMHVYFDAAWMKENILENHGPLCSIYAAHNKTRERNGFEYYAGDFQSEGDSPAFFHNIVTGLRNMESPDWGGWGGRYVLVRENTWLDPVPVEGYKYPEGRWYTRNAFGRQGTRERKTSETHPDYREYHRPMWRWTPALQNDFAARADWCVKSYENANHPPVVKLNHAVDLKAKPGETVNLSAKGTSDPDGDTLNYRWWQYEEADTYQGTVEIKGSAKKNASFKVPSDASSAKTIHIICEVTDSGTPQLTRYQRVVAEIQ